MNLTNDQRDAYMEQALIQAAIRRGFCAPNPAVGAVIVSDKAVIARGTHWASGQPHAEVDALNKLHGSAKGATLFVTLEPCCHWGKTPPCTKRIIESGITRVYYGFLDPNPEVAGQGVQQLQAAGIECEACLLPNIQDFYQSYAYWREHQRPWVTAKLAMSCDGKIAGAGGEPIQITGKPLQQFTQVCRQKSDAILTTIATVMNDDPQLNVRLGGDVQRKPVYVLDSQLRLPLNARLFQTSERLTVFHAPEVDLSRRVALEAKSVRCVPISRLGSGLSLDEALTVIGQDGLHDLWVEAGARCFRALYEAGLLQRAFIYVAPKVLGEQALDAAIRVADLTTSAQSVRWRPCGEDAVCDLRF